jgi:pimeloyl-ACP methyl ester carboxylesterase
MPFANNTGIRIHFEVEGSEASLPLIMQHGLQSSLETWRDSGYVAALKDDYRLILVDERGHGGSDKPHDPATYRPIDFTHDILSILDLMGIDKAAYWGYSMGASIGFHGIARYALSRFNSLILGGMSPYMMETEKRETLPRYTSLKMAAEQGMEAYISSLERKDGFKYHPDYRARLLANDPVALFAVIQSMSTWPGADDILSKINVPCLVYAGEADPFCSGAKKGAAAIPNARFVSFPGLNHVQTSRASELVLPHVKQFLAEVNSTLFKDRKS